MATATIMHTEDIVEANRIATQRGYNRRLTQEMINQLDEDGVHVVSWTMVHEHAAGVKVDPHVRAQILTKLKGKDGPATTYLDIDMKLFNELQTVSRDVAS